MTLGGADQRFTNLTSKDKEPQEIGCLEKIILGPMFSGKSTMLKRMIRRHNAAKRTCLTIRKDYDTRYHPSFIVTHDMEALDMYSSKMGCSVSCKSLSSIQNDVLHPYDVIAIDEGQFFDDIFDNVNRFVFDCGKIVIVASLDGWHDLKPCTEVLRLIPIAKSSEKLTSICSFCLSEDGSCTFRMQSGPEIVVGGAELYKAACLNCHRANQGPTE